METIAIYHDAINTFIWLDGELVACVIDNCLEFRELES